jgi:hypothetical protein
MSAAAEADARRLPGAPAPSAPEPGAPSRDAAWAVASVALAAALLACEVALKGAAGPESGMLVLRGRALLMPAGALACMIAVRLWPGRGRALALGGAVAAAAAALGPASSLQLAIVLAVTWRIAALRWSAGLRLLAAVAVAMLPGLARGGLLGPGPAALLALPAGPVLDRAAWYLLVPRVMLWQLERDHLDDGSRSLLAYAGSLALVLLAGAPLAVPIPHAILLGTPQRCERRASARALALLGAGVALLALGRWVHPVVWGPLEEVGRASARGALVDGLARAGRGGLWLSTLLYLPRRYLFTAGNVFVLTGQLGLLGFGVPSGFRRPFLSRSFVEFWQRWNHYYRDAALVLFFYPAQGFLRRRLPPRATLVAAVLAAFAGLAAIEFWLEPWTVIFRPHDLAPRYPVVASARLLAVGVVTAITAGLASRRGAAQPDRWGTAWRVSATLAGVTALSVVTRLLAVNARPGDLAAVGRFLLSVN